MVTRKTAVPDPFARAENLYLTLRRSRKPRVKWRQILIFLFMSDRNKRTDYYDNEDGTKLKVETYNDQIVVRQSNDQGQYPDKPHVTDHFGNPSVHITNEDGTKEWQGGPNPSPVNGINPDTGEVETYEP